MQIFRFATIFALKIFVYFKYEKKIIIIIILIAMKN